MQITTLGYLFKVSEPAMGVSFKNCNRDQSKSCWIWISIINTLIEIQDVENAKIALEKAKEVGHNGEVFEKLEANIQMLRNSNKETESV